MYAEYDAAFFHGMCLEKGKYKCNIFDLFYFNLPEEGCLSVIAYLNHMVIALSNLKILP